MNGWMFVALIVLWLCLPTLRRAGRWAWRWARRAPWGGLFRFRVGTVYGVKVIHEVTGKEVLGYVGKTWRKPYTLRILEHLHGTPAAGPQPWADVFVASFIIWQDRTNDLGLWWREILAIRVRRPLYNYHHNLRNRRRIPKYVAARRQRSVRCMAALAQRAARHPHGRPGSR